jgi:response regulator NasT
MAVSIIVAFPKRENAASIKNILVKHGLNVQAICGSGAQILQFANELEGGVVICGYRFADMGLVELQEYLPKGFELLVVASQAKWEELSGQEIVCLGMPIKVHELVSTVEMMLSRIVKEYKKQKAAPRPRTKEEERYIMQAKALLMERNNMSEEQAHRYIQKNSMDNGTSMSETARMIISLAQQDF